MISFSNLECMQIHQKFNMSFFSVIVLYIHQKNISGENFNVDLIRFGLGIIFQEAWEHVGNIWENRKKTQFQEFRNSFWSV